MSLPFTIEQFLDTFRRYNEGVWPAQAIIVLLAVATLWLASGMRRRAPTNAGRDARLVLGALAALWIWMAVGYHLAYFRAINPAATLFGIAFATQGGLFAWLALRREPPRFLASSDARGVAGAVLAGYALLAYPLLGAALGHRYPHAPTFGLPCPTTIFTFAILCWGRGVPRGALVVPLLWVVAGTSAALSLGMLEDLGLLGGALVYAATAGWRGGRAPERRTAAPIEGRRSRVPGTRSDVDHAVRARRARSASNQSAIGSAWPLRRSERK